MTIKCDRCQKELKEPGALLFGPPVPALTNDDHIECRKTHLCHDCYADIEQVIYGMSIIVYGDTAEKLVSEALRQVGGRKS